MKRLRLIPIALLALGTLAHADTLKVGDAPPALKVAKWVKGKPVEKFDAAKTYVVEFWATWCGPCLESIPHITELAKKHKDIAFTGVSVWENQKGDTSTDYQAKVVKFVKDMGAKMDYNVAYDDPNGTMAKTWMEAAGQDGIPASFVIHGGKVAWIGHPSQLDGVLDKIRAGTFDPKKEAAEREAAEAESRKLQAAVQPVFKAAGEGDIKKAVEELDKVLAENPKWEPMLAAFKLDLLKNKDEGEFHAYGKKLAEGMYKDDAMMLNQIAWSIVDDASNLKTPDVNLAITIASRASELTKHENAMILDTLAYAYFKGGKIDDAIKTQEKAIAHMDKTQGITDEVKAELKQRLEKFKKAKGG